MKRIGGGYVPWATPAIMRPNNEIVLLSRPFLWSRIITSRQCENHFVQRDCLAPRQVGWAVAQSSSQMLQLSACVSSRRCPDSGPRNHLAALGREDQHVSAAGAPPHSVTIRRQSCVWPSTGIRFHTETLLSIHHCSWDIAAAEPDSQCKIARSITARSLQESRLFITD